jgi:hypothetical protein
MILKILVAAVMGQECILTLPSSLFKIHLLLAITHQKVPISGTLCQEAVVETVAEFMLTGLQVHP